MKIRYKYPPILFINKSKQQGKPLVLCIKPPEQKRPLEQEFFIALDGNSINQFMDNIFRTPDNPQAELESNLIDISVLTTQLNALRADYNRIGRRTTNGVSDGFFDIMDEMLNIERNIQELQGYNQELRRMLP